MINSWFDEQFTESTFIGSAGVEIRYSLQVPKDSKGTLIISSGRTEMY